MRERSFGAGKIVLVQGDIARSYADVIVNAANSRLAGGGGVDGAIHDAGGPEIMAELDRIRPPGGCPAGSAVLTGAGRLDAKWVAHAVGPRWNGGGRREAELLAGAYTSSLELAASKGAATVVLPAISTGIYGYPVEKAAPVALGAVAGFLRERKTTVAVATFVLYDDFTLSVFERALAALP